MREDDKPKQIKAILEPHEFTAFKLALVTRGTSQQELLKTFAVRWTGGEFLEVLSETPTLNPKKDPHGSFTPKPNSDIPIREEDHRVNLLREILESGHARAVPAIEANLQCFAELVRGASRTNQTGSPNPPESPPDDPLSGVDADINEAAGETRKDREDSERNRRDRKRRERGTA